MRQWEMLYQRQPMHLDVALLVLALILHSPLALIHMKAPPKKGKASRLVNIDYIEQQIQKRKEKPVALPPQAPTKKIETMMKKVEEQVKKEVKQAVFKRSLPPPPPTTPKIPDQLIKGPEAAKLDAKRLQDKLNQDKKVLQGKGGFQGRELNLSNPNAAKDLKIGGAASTIQANSRLGGVTGPQGGTIQGKSGFQVSKDAMPMSIGGDSDGGLKMGGESNIVVVPVGARARADSSILSPTVKNKGSLQASGPAMAMGSGSGSAQGIAGGGGGAAIAIGGSGRGPAVAVPGPAVKAGKKLDENSLNNGAVDSARSPAPSAISSMPSIPRRAPKVQKPMFQITGPLANRQVIAREVPQYPDWARSKGIEAAVVLQFTVSPEGAVKDNIFVIRTSGYPQMDDLAVQALKKWKFATLPLDQYRDEVGSITFNFSVR